MGRAQYLIAAHPIQQALLHLVAGAGIDELSLRELGSACGDASPQQVKHHLGQMVKYGFLDIVGGRYVVGKHMRASR